VWDLTQHAVVVASLQVPRRLIADSRPAGLSSDQVICKVRHLTN
jgi:hypothetical protein